MKDGTLNGLIALVVVIVTLGGIGIYSENQSRVSCVKEPIPYSRTNINNPIVPQGIKRLDTAGVDGLKEVCKKKSGQLVSETTITEPIAEVMSIGTKPPTPVIQYEETVDECPVTTCNDGTCSNSVGRGTCSWHQGVAHY